jgi:hypothetical protein
MRHWAAVLIMLCLMCLGMVPIEIFWIAGFLALIQIEKSVDSKMKAMLAED